MAAACLSPKVTLVNFGREEMSQQFTGGERYCLSKESVTTHIKTTFTLNFQLGNTED